MRAYEKKRQDTEEKKNREEEFKKCQQCKRVQKETYMYFKITYKLFCALKEFRVHLPLTIMKLIICVCVCPPQKRSPNI